MPRPIIPPPLQALAVALGMAAAARWLPPAAVAVPGQTLIAAGLAGLGLAIDLVSVLRFWRQKTTVNPLRPEAASRLVISGLYRVSRNPMYLGMALILAGWAVWLGHAIAAAGPFLFMLVLTRVQILPEEAALEARFGDDYRAYKARVRRWI
ncbi:DUF1295 domain-containing protein [Microvirga tunisiensis]|uniref:DUF1295 domain-containing protein n=1 Tax=Pannonibacter tanglangensis TaxID=2750084 RepID=A0A7X5J982_9HYPH|nr:isoprenylcysteine carboxylmethyltransferase family protein [Pannonibacter sp. XCT-53]NBN79544.1 DUF1295 domain-containing protein [Pannonibacter sp. XCT-53]